MGQCNDCGDVSIPQVDNTAQECCELTPANCVVTSEYQNFFKIGKGKTLTYALDKIANYVKALATRVSTLESLHNYKTIEIVLTQAGVVAPTGTVLDNQFSGTPTYGYTSPGKYTIVLTGAFTANKTVIDIKEWNIGWGEKVKAYWVDVDTIAVESGGASLDFIDDDIITSMPIEIKVYN